MNLPFHQRECAEEDDDMDSDAFPFALTGEDNEPTPAVGVLRAIGSEADMGSIGEQKCSDNSAPGSLASTAASTLTPSTDQSILQMCMPSCNSAYEASGEVQVNTGKTMVQNSVRLPCEDSQVIIVPGQVDEQREELDSEPNDDVGVRLWNSNTGLIASGTENDQPELNANAEHENNCPPASMMQTIGLTRALSATPGESETIGLESRSFSKLMFDAGSVKVDHKHENHILKNAENKPLDPPWSHPRGVLADLLTESDGERNATYPKSRPKQKHSLSPYSCSHFNGIPSASSPGRANVEQLGDDSFIASVQLGTLLSARDVGATMANPELLTAWFEPTRSIHVESPAPSYSSSEGDRLYDGEWIEATTSALALPAGHQRCLHGFLSSTQRAFGFPLHTGVAMFVERQRNQVVLKLQYSRRASAIHTLTVHETRNSDGEHEDPAGSRSSIMVTDVIYLERGEDSDSSCCGAFSDFVWVPSLLDLAVQAAASLNSLAVLISCGVKKSSAHRSGGGRSGCANMRIDRDGARDPLLVPA